MNKISTTNTMAMVTLPNPSSLQLHKTFTFKNLTNPMNFKASKASSKTHICNFSNMVDIISQQSSMLNNKNNNTIINKTHILQLGVGLLAASMVITTPLDANATRLNYYATVADPPCELNYVRSGLGYCDLNVGSGVKAPRGELINVHYTARFADGTVFDSTYQRGRP
ncbi:hypothetical protein Leryth_024976 [Lithospermum erythrorhizon]|nr:hypothetical protein Leryth_024976 [Lithospermum erythrorhizon]